MAWGTQVREHNGEVVTEELRVERSVSQRELEAAAAAEPVPQWVREPSAARPGESPWVRATPGDRCTQRRRWGISSSYLAKLEAPAPVPTCTAGPLRLPGEIRVGSRRAQAGSLGGSLQPGVWGAAGLPFWYAETDGADCSSLWPALIFKHHK